MRGGEKVNICLLIFLAVVSQINLGPDIHCV